MSRAAKVFRYLWRINAVLILLASAVFTIGIGLLLFNEFGFTTARNRIAGIPVGPPDLTAHLKLGRVLIVEGTNVMRADLTSDRGGKGFSSGGYSETRNILFIEPEKKEAHWLLLDNDHVINDTTDITEGSDRNSKRIVATAV